MKRYFLAGVAGFLGGAAALVVLLIVDWLDVKIWTSER